MNILRVLVGAILRLAAIIAAAAAAGAGYGNNFIAAGVLAVAAFLIWVLGGRLIDTGTHPDKRKRSVGGSRHKPTGRMPDRGRKVRNDDEPDYVFEDVQVMGRDAYQHALRIMREAFEAGAHVQIMLVREPNNPHDRNAIRVDASWSDDHAASDPLVIGYLSRGLAKTIGKRQLMEPEILAFELGTDGETVEAVIDVAVRKLM